MKLIFPFTLFLIISTVALSQEYFRFPTDTAQWNVESYYSDRNNREYWIDHYFIDGDTIINDFNYAKIYYGQTGYDTIIDTIYATYLGGMREDENKHIYFLSNQYIVGMPPNCYSETSEQQEEILLYRFDISIGDTFRLYPYWPGVNLFEVKKIDSVLVGQSYRKRFKIDSPNFEFYDDYWVEGIGSQFSLFGPLCYFFEGADFLMCYKEPEILYMGLYNSDGVCKYDFVDVKEVTENQIKLSPNPAINYINVSVLKNNNLKELCIFSISGTMVYTSDELCTDSYIIDVSKFSKGLYFISARLQNGELITNKLIIR